MSFFQGIYDIIFEKYNTVLKNFLNNLMYKFKNTFFSKRFFQWFERFFSMTIIYKLYFHNKK